MKHLLLPLFFLVAAWPTFGQHVGIGTATPTAVLDINGDVVFRTASLTVTDSVITALDVNTEKYSSYRITAADSAFTITGITAGMDGRMLTLVNQSGQVMTIAHEDTTAAIPDQIITPAQTAIVLDPMKVVELRYDSVVQKWIIHHTNLAVGETVWDTVGNNIYFENFVGIGTNSPATPLTIETEVNEIGFSHMAGEDSITVASTVTAIAGAVGTSSDHVFSLQAGGEGKLHVWPDGDVVIGEDSIVSSFNRPSQSRMNEFDSKLTVITPINETGFTHVGGDNEIVVNESIGAVSASIGTITNHNFRLKTNGLGRLHVLNDGRVWIGANEDFPFSQFSVFTPDLTNGISHIGQSGQVLATRVGGPNGSVAIGSFSPSHFRLLCNGANAINIINGSLNVGIGIDFPAEKLSVFTADNQFGISHSSAGGVKLATHIGVVSASFGTVTNNRLRFVTNNNTVMSLTPTGNVGIGIDEPINKFEVNGTMRSKEVIVELSNWPDYVFEKAYPLMPLQEVRTFIEENGHLPGIPPAEEIIASGLAMGEMQTFMMEKIEELTLYILQLHNRIDELERNAAK